MPNDITNILSFSGDPEAIRNMLDAIKDDEEGYGSIDFDKILPMPPELNIESGSRTTDGLNAYIAFAEIYTLGQETDKVDLLNIPKKSEDAFLRRRTDIDPRTWELGRQAFQNMQKYGTPTWYEWHSRHWGTKWNAYDCNLSGNDLSFLTAWNAPHPIIQKLSEQLPDIRIHHAWADEDIGINCGYRDYLGGTVTDEWLPYERKESIEFAAEVLNFDPSDYGLVLNADETDYIWAGSNRFKVMELLGQRVLHSDTEMGLSEIPLGMYLYHLGTGDHGERYNCVSIVRPERFGGSVIALQPLNLGSNGLRALAENEAPRFTGEKLTMEELLQESITAEEGMGGMNL